MLLYFISYGQARSSIGLGLSANRPLSSDYKIGHGFDLQPNIRVSDKFAIVPELGFKKINSNGRFVYRNGYYYTTIQNLNTFYLGLGGKYYWNSRWFAGLMGNIHISGGNEDLISGGYGGNATVGYDMPLDARNNLEFSFRTDLMQLQDIDDKLKPVLGLRVAYKFNFRKR
ncbi:MAG: hypothetical protein EOP46_19340 [Sphingobacteriaceae bacterium]|nr:MAG: hypothetical protein EOP46_19340 [Sphingobacteriaceae bacterium]